jgi:hypothetical protein
MMPLTFVKSASCKSCKINKSSLRRISTGRTETYNYLYKGIQRHHEFHGARNFLTPLFDTLVLVLKIVFIWQKETKSYQKKRTEKLSQSSRSSEGILPGEYIPWAAVYYKGFC